MTHAASAPQPTHPHPAPRSGLVVLVTGASSGVGAEVVRALAGAGHRVHAAARRTTAMAPLREAGAQVHHLDLTDAGSVAALVTGIEADEGRIDVLLNIAGYGLLGPVEEIAIDDARRQFEVNLFGLGDLTAKVLPGMRRRGRGRIVNVTSIAGTVYEPMGAWYHATKAALDRWSDCLRVELAPHGIEVVTVRPAGIRTPWRDIAQASLRENARGTDYERQARGAGRLLGLITHSPVTSSTPDVVARDIVAAATAVRPARVVPSGRGARALMGLVTALPTAVVDTALVQSVRLLGAVPSRRRGR